MKKMLLMMLAGLLVAACEKPVLGEVEDESESVEMGSKNDVKKFTFTVKGDFGAPTFTRGYLSADGSEMTNLWVFDYVDGECVQKLVQEASDEEWGQPKMLLTLGSHHIYFVASRGDEPVLDEAAHTITWSTTRDTFWKDYEVEVVNTSNGNRAVTLDRVATKLRIVVNDEVPAEVAKLVVTPKTWYYGLDYVTGLPVGASEKARSVNVPAAYVGTSGQLTMSIYGLSGRDEWKTDVDVKAVDTGGAAIGYAQIKEAPFVANRASEYNGKLFSGGGFSLDLASDWSASYSGSW